ncbi:hypothetical protein [Streptomyces sp. NPDC001820]|uniref:hypothetical protein n=1 Tax=Streptomyces sp. NPDC001820 TaxID=3364613 RepID=UPI0036BFF998
MKNGQVALALAGGYLLGRSHKMRWALTLGGMAAGSRFLPGSDALGTKLLKSPELSKLTDTVRDELLSAGKTAAVAAAGNRINSLSDRMQRRASSLRAGPEAEEPHGEDEDEEEPRDEDEEEPRDEDEEEEAEEEEEESAEEAKEQDRQRPARKPVASEGRTKKAAARPAADKKKTTGSRSSQGKSAAAGRSTPRSRG